MPTDNPSHIDLVQRAAAYCAHAHAGQRRKDNQTPYAAHPTRVAMLVTLACGVTDPEVIAAAYLHDTIEDTTTDRDDLDEHFTERTADLVVALTKDPRLPEPQRERLYDQALTSAPWEAKLIKLADLYDNLSDAHTADPATRERLIEKCNRGLTIARADDNASAGPLAHAIKLLENKLKSTEA